MGGEFAFDADTRVAAAGPEGVYAAELTRRWDGTAGAVNGGYMLATCIRALARAMPFPDPVVVSGFFLKPGAAGPARIRTSVIRSGRTTAFGESVLAQDGTDVVRATAAFARLGRDGPVFTDGAPPDLLALPLLVDSTAPAVLELGAGSTTIQLTVHLRARPAPGWLAGRAVTRFVSGGYHEEDFEIWDSAGALVAQSRQLALIVPL
jgi:acyl-CoA thioesterase